MPAVVMVIAAVIAAAGTAYGAVSASEAAKKQEDLAKKQADMELAAAQREADAIHGKASRFKQLQIAALAGSGVQIESSGSGAEMLKETDRLAEQDALSALITGRNKSTILQGQADMWGDKATSSLVAGGLNTASTVMNSYNAYKSAGGGST